MSLQSPEQREVGLSIWWSVVSYWPHQCDQYLHCQNTNVDLLTLPVPLHWSFTLDAVGMLWKMSEGHHKASYSPNLKEFQWCCCWAGSKQFTLCGTSSVSSLSGVCSSRVVGVHWTHLACPIIQRGVPSARVIRKISFGGGLMSILSTSFYMVQRDSFSNLVFHFIQFLLPLVLHFSLPPLSISFSHDQATCLQ